MMPRSQLIAVLVAIEVVVAAWMIVAVRGDQSDQWSPWGSHVEAASDSNLSEGGAHKIFEAGSHPALNVDIGYADLTIRTGAPSQFDVSVSQSTEYGIFRATAPISATKDGETIHIMSDARHRWAMGDDRMVTVVVPPETRVVVVNAGDITADGLRAEATFNSIGNGSITVEDYDGPELHVAASNGRISLDRVVATRLNATTSNGRLEGTSLEVRDGKVESSNGRVTLRFAKGADTLVNAEASNGKIHVSGLPAAASVQTTDNSGDDDNDADNSVSRTVRLGAGNGQLDVEASNGSIYISQ
jgi:hypothetical protein